MKKWVFWSSFVLVVVGCGEIGPATAPGAGATSGDGDGSARSDGTSGEGGAPGAGGTGGAFGTGGDPGQGGIPGAGGDPGPGGDSGAGGNPPRPGPVPSWVIYPGEEWTWLQDASAAGLDPARWSQYVSAQPYPGSCGGDVHSGGLWGTCVQRGGYMLYCWGDPDYTYNSASVGKAFNGFVLQLAIDKGIVTGNERVCDIWPDCPSDCGEVSTLRNLFNMQGGFATSNGFQDGCNNQVCGGGYSSGGQWRLNQTMTYILGENLKDFLDRELFGPIGIDPEDWYWLSGAEVYNNEAPPNAGPGQNVLYPNFTSADRWYGCFVDPPYTIGGHTVVGGGGWVGMSPKDLARVGLLLASDGWWDGRQLVSKTGLVEGHEGCGGSDLRGAGGDNMFSWGRVATEGVWFPDASLIVGPIQAN